MKNTIKASRLQNMDPYCVGFNALTYGSMSMQPFLREARCSLLNVFATAFLLLCLGCDQGKNAEPNKSPNASNQPLSQNKEQPGLIIKKTDNTVPGKYFSRDKMVSSIKIENLIVNIPINDYETNAYSLKTSDFSFPEGDYYYFKPNKSVTLLLTVKDKIPIITEALDDKNNYRANDIFYYSRFNPDRQNKIVTVNGIDLSSTKKHLAEYFFKEGVRTFTTTITQEGATGPIEVESQTNINVISFSSAREYPYGLESLVPWRYPYPPQFNSPRKEGPTLEDFQPQMMLFYRVNQNDYLIRLNGKSSHENNDERFAKLDVSISDYEPGIILTPANSEVVEKFRAARKQYSIKTANELIEILRKNDSFEQCVNSVIGKSLAFASNHKESVFQVNIDQLNRFQENRDYSFSIRSVEPLRLLPWSSESIFSVDCEAEAASDGNYPLSWNIHIPGKRPNGSPSPYTIRHKNGGTVFSTEYPELNARVGKYLDDKSNIKMTLKCNWGKNVINLHFVKPGHPIDYEPGKIPVVVACSALNQKIFFVFQSQESPDGTIRIEDHKTISDEIEDKVVVLSQNRPNYELKGYSNIVFTVVK